MGRDNNASSPRRAIEVQPVDQRALSDAHGAQARQRVGAHHARKSANTDFLRVAPLPPRKRARGAFDPPCAPRLENGVGTRDVPTHRRDALAARRRTRDDECRTLLAGGAAINASGVRPTAKVDPSLESAEGLTNPKENETDNCQWQQPLRDGLLLASPAQASAIRCS
jgi:hypothetical protein